MTTSSSSLPANEIFNKLNYPVCIKTDLEPDDVVCISVLLALYKKYDLLSKIQLIVLGEGDHLQSKLYFLDKLIRKYSLDWSCRAASRPWQAQ